MSPRNPEESPEEAMQDKVLRPVDETPENEASAQAEPVQDDAPALAVQPETARDTKAESDRVATYLKGPTVFSA